MARESGPDQERMIKDPEGSSKALLLAAAALSAIDTARKVPFAGKKGLDKLEQMDSSDLQSIVENQVEGTDIAENFGMEPGALSTYITGLILDVADPLTIGATALKVPGIIARLAKPAGKALTQSGIKDVLKKSVDAEMMSDVPVLAKEAQDSGLYKFFSKPSKGVEMLKGKKELKNIGTPALPIMSMEKTSKGTLDRAGEDIADILRRAKQRGAEEVSVPDIQSKIIKSAKKSNLDTESSGVQDISSLERALDDILKPTKKVKKELPPPVPKEALEELPPPVPMEARPKGLAAGTKKPSWLDEEKDMGLPDRKSNISELSYKMDEFETVPDVLDIESLWKKRQSIDDQIKYNKKMPLTDQLSEKQRILREARNETDLAIQEAMKKVRLDEGYADDAYRSAKASYKTKSQLSDIMEKAEVADARRKGGGMVQEAATGTGRVAASGGANVPFVAGRLGGNIAERVYSKGKIMAGDMLQNPYPSTMGVEAMTEVPEIPFDPKYREDKGLEGEQPTSPTGEIRPEDLGEGFEGYSLAPKSTSVEQIPQAEEVGDIMSPQPQAPVDDVDQRMTETLAPQKQQWDPYFNEEVLNTFLPRDSERILANPTALLAKMHQVAPNQVAMFKEMMQNDPEGIKEAAPKLAMMYPAVFEKDKYGTFDGKILDPALQQKFLFDLAEDEEMSSIEKAEMAMKVQRGESIHS